METWKCEFALLRDVLKCSSLLKGIFMYVHIGNDEILNRNDVIAVFDVEMLKTSRQNLRILNKLKDRNNSSDKSVIIINKKNKEEIIFSNIAVSTLKKRLEKDTNSYFPDNESK